MFDFYNQYYSPHLALLQAKLGEVQRTTEDLLLLFRKVSLDEDLEDSLRGDLMVMMSEGANDIIDTLRKVKDQQDKRTQSEIASAAMESIRDFQKTLKEK